MAYLNIYNLKWVVCHGSWSILCITIIWLNKKCPELHVLILQFWIFHHINVYRRMIVAFLAESHAMPLVGYTTAVAQNQAIVAVSNRCFCTHPVCGVFVFGFFAIDKTSIQQINSALAIANEFSASNCANEKLKTKTVKFISSKYCATLIHPMGKLHLKQIVTIVYKFLFELFTTGFNWAKNECQIGSIAS